MATSCSDDPGDSGGAEAGAGDRGCEATVPGTELTYGVWNPTSSLDPVFTVGGLVGGTEIAAIYDVLFTYDETDGTLTPRLAESIEHNDDHTEWTLELRDGIEYSDGTPLTAQLVSANMDRFLAPRVVNNAGGFLTPVEEKRVVGETTLEFTLSRPWPDFPVVFADEPGMIVNLNAIGDDVEAFGEDPPPEAGLGPYVVERANIGDEIVLRARDDYWGGPVCIQTVRFAFVPEAQPTYEAFLAGDLDVAFLRYQPTIEQAKEAGEESHFIHQDAGGLFLLNHRQGRPGSDDRVREALWLGLNADGVNDRTYQGTLPIRKALIQPGSTFETDGVESVPTDTERAAGLIEEARTDGWDGTLEITCSNPADEALAAEGMWEDIGVDVEIEYKAQNEQIGSIVEGDYDAACWGFNVAPGTAPNTLIRNLGSDSSSNRMGYQNRDMDRALDQLLSAESPAEQADAMTDVNNIYVEDFVAPTYGAVEEGIVWKPEIHGIVPTLSSIFLFDRAYIER